MTDNVRTLAEQFVVRIINHAILYGQSSRALVAQHINCERCQIYVEQIADALRDWGEQRYREGVKDGTANRQP